MTIRRFRSLGLALGLLAFALAATAAPSAAPAKKPLSYGAYDGWRSIQGTRLSRDGVWLAYALVPQEGDGELVVRNLGTGAEFRAPRGKQPELTPDGKFVVFVIAPLQADLDQAKKDKKKPEDQPKPGLGIMDLATGAVASVERVKSFKLPEESSARLAYLLEPPVKKPEEKKAEEKKAEGKKLPETAPARPGVTAATGGTEPAGKEEDGSKDEKKKEPGTDLVVRELATGAEAKIPEVTEYAWNKPGTRLAYAVSSKAPENDGAFVRDADGGTTALLKGPGHYKSLVFAEGGGRLAFVSDRDDFKSGAPAFKLYYWSAPVPSPAGTAAASAAVSAGAAVELAPAAAKGFPAGRAVSEHGKLSFSKDGLRLFFGIADAPQPEPKDAPEPVKADIWSTVDDYLQPMQKARAEEEKKRSDLCVMHLGLRDKDRRFVRLATPDLPDIVLSEDGKLAVGSSDLPYRRLISWDRGYRDISLVAAADGSRRKILEKTPRGAALSPGGTHLLFFNDEDNNYYAYRVADGKTFNLTGRLGVRFDIEVWDTPSEPAPYGVAGWTDGDAAVLLYDRYDIWEVSPDGLRARMITQGAGRRDRIVYRYLNLDPELKTVPLKIPVLLTAADERTRATGAYRVTLASGAAPEKILMQDALLGGWQKAKNAEVYVFTRQRFEEFPDLWTSGPDFAAARKVSAANPQQADYAWGAAELIDYVNADGKTLPAVLIKPDGFDPSKKYPLLVYIYELMTPGLHRYYPPAPGTNVNFSRYVSRGYVVLMPDIVYDIGYPGPSALKCVLPAVQKVMGLGWVDPARVGIQGHSWGGYQISYLITQTDIFAAVEAGASVTNMTSAYGGIRWGTGMSRAFQYEKTQSRIGAPLWNRTLQFIENSPLFWVEKVRTPYLTIHNDEDDAVPWYQGIEFVSALRRLDKPAWMFNYNGEKHGLRERENQKHWTVHLDEFFDHYLLGAPMPAWMERGVPYLERTKRDVRPLFKAPEAKSGGEKK